ncbi:CRISPR-associated endonuclease Cas3'' [Oleiagrimonas sp. C23AA]|uniref:CRISPR-associated endonuclease Cas3'' n=1 Tax=Oleiagrimonas sp. C23AA TaxID=2719047 RepID=UPI00141DA604|nr:CRISPR-associated endonuclease Cas3'' [Oleiagrimonas sp. C23AA]NII11267.1 CRISPR-associated endonuclease Cas3'' [Oleiagrimonas sp. C23AA]
MDFYAHSSPRGDRSDWQRLRDHLIQVGDYAAAFAAPFGGEELARVAGRLHDLGKYTQRFQDRLRGEIPKVDHATWGAVIARDRYPLYGHLLAYGIAGHHAGLANGINGENRPALSKRLSCDYLAGLPLLLDDWQQEIDLPSTLSLPRHFTPRPSRAMFQLTLLARMIFSCLVDADFIDTDNFYRTLEGEAPRPVGHGPSLQALRENLDVYLGQPRFTPDTEIKRRRHQILGHVRAQATRDRGLFSLTVPTGGGKTLSSLAFALDHAITHGMDRVIYVIPFTSIIEQNAQVFRDAFGALGEDAVLEHHSAFDDSHIERQSKEKRQLAMQNWDAPVVVTTAVQFFESLFADRPSRCRKLHHIANSVVILDEAQTLPLDLLRPCTALLDELALNYRASIVLCTATQPVLREDQGLKGGLGNVHELAPDPPTLYRQFRRVSTRHVGTLDDVQLEQQLRGRKQVLCIVNNRRHARHLFERIEAEDGACHLSTFMTAQHRSAMLKCIRQRLHEGQPCRLISTSLIEAGVDISLPTVLRAEAGLDAIAQAAGRCNREGTWPVEASEVQVFRPGNADWAPPRQLQVFAKAFQAIEPTYRDDLLSLDAVHAYFQELYFRLGDAALDDGDLLGMIQRCSYEGLPFETLAQQFQIIKTGMRPVIVPFDWESGERDPDVECVLRDLAFAPAAARKLQTRLVQVPQKAYDALWQAHAIEPIAPERYGEQFVQLVNPRLYDPRFGLHWDNPQFLAGEQLVL